MHHGRFAGLTSSEIEARYPGHFAERAAAKYTWRFPAGESYEDAHRRAAMALATIASHGVRGPLLVSHEMIGRMLIAHLLGLEPDAALRLNQPHDVVYSADPSAGRLIELRAVGAPGATHT